MKFLTLFILFSSIGLASENSKKLKGINTLTRFAFGSCNKEWKKQPLWKHIIEDAPQLFLWGGDNIYGDKGPNKNNFFFKIPYTK